MAEPALAPVAEAMGDGWLSTTKAHVIERAVDRLPGNPDLRARGVQVLLADAKRLDASELRKVALHLVTVVDPDGDERRDERALPGSNAPPTCPGTSRSPTTRPAAPGSRAAARSEDAALIKATLIPLAAPQPADGADLRPRHLHHTGLRSRRPGPA